MDQQTKLQTIQFHRKLGLRPSSNISFIQEQAPSSPKLDERHDFTGKLRQSSILPKIIAYIDWQKAVRTALSKGQISPEMPVGLGPTSLNLDATTACNDNCGHCVDLDILNSGMKFRHEKMLQSLGFMIEQGLRSVILIGGGEPTLYPGFVDTVRFLKERNIKVAVVSNGSRNKKIAEVAHLFTRGDWVRLSLDSAKNHTFQLMHRPKQPMTLEERCSSVALIKSRNSTLDIGFSFVITWQGAEQRNKKEEIVGIVPNIDEMVMAAHLARNSGFSYIAYKPFLTRYENGTEVMDSGSMESFKNTLVRIRSAIEEAKELQMEGFRVIESINLRLLEQETWRNFTNQPTTCHMQAIRQVLSPLGLYNCPAYRGVAKARIAGADAYETSENVTKTQRATASILRSFNANNECAEITCLYNHVNWWLEKAVRGEIPLEELEATVDREDYFL
ncbi:MAG: radical SAM protein [bacterium]|nr:radical SAM protein [bacterium]